MRHYLIVDDNRAFAENLSEIVLDLGHEVTVDENGAEALRLAKARRFDAGCLRRQACARIHCVKASMTLSRSRSFMVSWYAPS